MLKEYVSLLFKKFTNSRANNSRILRNKKVKFSGYCFYMNTNIQGDSQICINVPLNVFATDNPRNKFILNSTVYRANQLWHYTLMQKTVLHYNLLRNKIKTWRSDRCQCQVCSRFLANIVYFQLDCCFLVDTWQNCAIVKFKWSKCNFSVKQ